MIPIIDLSSPLALRQIEDAYTTVGFAVFTNGLDKEQQNDMDCWFDEMQYFFDLDLKTKMEYPYEG